MNNPVSLHLINALFQDLTGQDVYIARQIEAAIEQSIDPALTPETRWEEFFRQAETLLSRLSPKPAGHGFSFWNAAAGPGFQPLLARQELIRIFRKLSPHPRATVVIGNLRSGICPPGCRWSPRRHEEYSEAVSFIEELARAASPSHSKLVLLFL